MSKISRSSALAALALLAGIGASGGAYAATQPPSALGAPKAHMKSTATDEQKAFDDLVKARVDLHHGWNAAARNRMENAETILLNAQSSGHYNAPAALSSIDEARTQLAKHDAKGASASLQKAESALHTAA
jgi:hypothetical protein